MKTLMLTLLLGAASPALARPGGHGGPGGPGHGPPLHVVLEHRADEIGVSPEIVQAVRELALAEEEASESLRQSLRERHEALREAIEAERPVEADVMAASAELGVAETAMREHHLRMTLEIRALLTPEQWEALRPPRGERPHHGERHHGERSRSERL